MTGLGWPIPLAFIPPRALHRTCTLVSHANGHVTMISLLHPSKPRCGDMHDSTRPWPVLYALHWARGQVQGTSTLGTPVALSDRALRSMLQNPL